MPLNLTIEKAAKIVGSQAKLAEIMGEQRTHISNWKAGTRTCTIDKRIKLAEIAGDDPTRAIIEGLIAQLDQSVELQAGAARMLQSMLDAFPPDHSLFIRGYQGSKDWQLLSTRRRRRRVQVTGNCGLCNIKPHRQSRQGHPGFFQPHQFQFVSI